MHKKLWCKRSFAPFYKHYIKCEDTKDFQKRIDYNVTNGVVFLERSIEMCPLDVYAFRNEICPHSTYCDTCGRELHYIPLEWAKSKLVNGVSFHYYMIYTCLHGIECNLQKRVAYVMWKMTYWGIYIKNQYKCQIRRMHIFMTVSKI